MITSLRKFFRTALSNDGPKYKLVPVRESPRTAIPMDEDAQEVVYMVIDKVLEFILQEALELVMERGPPRIITIADIHAVLNRGSIDLGIKRE